MAEIVEVIHKINYEVNDAALLRQLSNLEQLSKHLGSVEQAGKKTTSSLSQVGSGLLDGLGVGGGIAGITATAVNALKNVAAECIKTAIAASRTEQAFDNLNSPLQLAALRKATRGTVADVELMRIALSAGNLQLPLEKLGTLLEYARNKASETGESVTVLTQKLIEGIGNQSEPVLRSLGINAEELNTRFTQTGDFATAAFDTITMQAPKAGAAVDSLAEKADRISTRFENLKKNLGTLLADGGNFLYEALFSSVTPTGQALNALEIALDNYTNGDRNRRAGAQKILSGYVNRYKEADAKEQKRIVKEARDQYNDINEKSGLAPLVFMYELFFKAIEVPKTIVKSTPKQGKRSVSSHKPQINYKIPLPDDIAAEEQRPSQTPTEDLEALERTKQLQAEIKAAKDLEQQEAERQKAAEEAAYIAWKKRMDDRINGYKTLADAAVQAFQTIYGAQLKALDKEIDIRQKRVDAATKLAERGNTEVLKLEQEKLEAAQKQREEYARRQQVVNAALAVSNAVVAVAQAAGQTGAGAIVIVPAVIAAIIAGYAAISAATRESTAQAFADGVINYRGKGGPRDDANWVRISAGESIITAAGTAANHPILEAINNGMQFKLLDMPVLRSPGTIQTNDSDNSKQNIKALEKKLDGIIAAIEDNRMKQNIYFNEQGVGIMTQKAIKRDQNRYR